MYIPRILEVELREQLDKPEILAVIGPRQCGKTTLLRNIFAELQGAVFLDFEDRETLELFETDLRAFISLYVEKYRYVFIDEFQYAKNGGKNLKYIYDHHKTKIIISGSSATDLSIQSIKYLVGRIFVFSLHPFSFEEYLSYKDKEIYTFVTQAKLSPIIVTKILPLFQEFCIYGGYPRVLLATTKEEKELVLRNIYNTYLLKEIKEILQLPDDYKLTKLLHALALQTGNMIHYNELSRITGFSYQDLVKYLNILEKTFVCIRSQPYHTNKRTELAKVPKIFFVDTGFRNAIIKNFQELHNRTDKGALHENFVATELYKAGLDVKYWRTKSDAEVDFVVEKNGELIPIEVKSTLKDAETSRSFLSFVEKYSPKKKIILSESFSGEKKGVFFRPIFFVGWIVRR
ncbi:MAG: ATP-binding protein [Nanoarchaeota archaeon]